MIAPLNLASTCPRKPSAGETPALLPLCGLCVFAPLRQILSASAASPPIVRPAEHAGVSPHRRQQPGWPRLPQQFRRVRSLRQLFDAAIASLTRNGISRRRMFENMSEIFGFPPRPPSESSPLGSHIIVSPSHSGNRIPKQLHPRTARFIERRAVGFGQQVELGRRRARQPGRFAYPRFILERRV